MEGTVNESTISVANVSFSESEEPIQYTAVPPKKDYYLLLGLHRHATPSQIHEAYGRLSNKVNPSQKHYFPNTLPLRSLSKHEYWYLLNEAYDVLMNTQHRTTYDLYGEHGLKTGVDLFGYFAPPYKFSGDCWAVNRTYHVRNRHADTTPTDMIHPGLDRNAANSVMVLLLPVSLEDAFHGTTKQVVFPRVITCSEGMSTHHIVHLVHIQPGTVNGTRLILRGMGNVYYGEACDLVIVVDVVPHPLYTVYGVHLARLLDLPLCTALMGGIVSILGIDGKNISFPLQGPVKQDLILVLRGEGMPIPNTTTRGDLFIQFTVKLPYRIPTSTRMELGELMLQCQW